MAAGTFHRAFFRMGGVSLMALSLGACSEGFDLDLRNNFNGFDTSSAVRSATESRPKADNRGVISYPNYQVAVARGGDTVADVANRVGLPASELSKFNGIGSDVTLRKGEILALPRRVEEPSPATGSKTTGPLKPVEPVDITTLAEDAIDKAEPAQATKTRKPADTKPSGREPIRHKVERGETAFSVARLYDISAKSLADWNGLDSNFSVREGQFLLIPIALAGQAAKEEPKVTAPGKGTATPTPPSATKALPKEETVAKVDPPKSQDLSKLQTKASAARMLSPVDGKIIRAFVPGKTDGIDIAAPVGAAVKAADSGSIVAITKDTDKVAYVVLRHGGNLLSVYGNVGNLKVKKGDSVKRGQVIGSVIPSSPSFLHFQVRDGVDPVDPVDYLN